MKNENRMDKVMRVLSVAIWDAEVMINVSRRHFGEVNPVFRRVRVDANPKSCLLYFDRGGSLREHVVECGIREFKGGENRKR